MDAAYLGVWAVAGSDKALHLGFGIPAVILLGVITAVGGGLVRDLLAGHAPTIFQAGPLYTIAALIGSIIFVGRCTKPDHRARSMPSSASARY